MFTSFYPLLPFRVAIEKLSFGREAATTQRTLGKLIVCRTNDEVNADLARSWCDDHGLDFQLADQRDDWFPADAGALAIDLNYLAFDAIERTQLVERLCQAALPYPVAVAGYDLTEDVKRRLRARGVLVFRRIDRQMLYRLVAAIDFERAAVAA